MRVTAEMLRAAGWRQLFRWWVPPGYIGYLPSKTFHEAAAIYKQQREKSND